jgi:hypothetical protein
MQDHETKLSTIGRKIDGRVPVSVRSTHVLSDQVQVCVTLGESYAETAVYLPTDKARELAHALLECAQHYDEAAEAARASADEPCAVPNAEAA